MKRLWYKISQIGIDGSINHLELRYISLMNEITVLRSLFLFAIAGLMTSYLPQSETIIIVIVSASIIMMMPLMMNKRRMYLLARIFFSTSAFLAITVLSFLLGNGTLSFHLLLVVILVTYFIFPPSQSNVMYLLLWIIGSTFFYLEIFGIYPLI